MDPSKWHNLILPVLCACICIAGCDFRKKPYSGSLDLKNYTWLKGKKIFIDPGHGGSGLKDLFRMGPGGISEEEINLRVALILTRMLRESGANVEMSRKRDRDISLPDRVEMVKNFQPELLVGIHHNGTVRRMDGVNYPAVLIWGTDAVNAASGDFAMLLIGEFNKIMDRKGKLMSDFAVFPETGTMLLRETRYICPGVIGEAGFFSDEVFAKHLKDEQYNQVEAEAYYAAIAEYFHRGIPRAEVRVSCPVENSAYLKNLIRDESPSIVINAESGSPDTGIDEKSFNAELDGLPVKCVPITNSLYKVLYGKKLYPGAHSLRFSFRNRRFQHSVIYGAAFNLEVKKGDYDTLLRDGTRFIDSGKNIREGIRMLKAAVSMTCTDPGADKILWDLARGYERIADHKNAAWYRAKLYYFYPQSAYRKKLEWRFRDYRFPVEYLGKPIDVRYDPEYR